MANSVDVWLMEFDRRVEDPAAKLSQTFGLDRHTAGEIEQTLPRAVKKGIDPISAEQYAQALRGIGARVEVRPARQQAATPGTHATPGSAGTPMGAQTLGAMPVASASGAVAPTVTGPRSLHPAMAGSNAPRKPVGDENEFKSKVIASRAPHAGFTAAWTGLMRLMVGGVLLAVALNFRGTAYRGTGDFLDVLLDWVAGTLVLTGLIDASYGFIRRRERSTIKIAAFLVLAGLVAAQYVNGNVVME